MVKIRPHQLNHRANFGTIKEELNPNTGSNSKIFVSEFALWCAFRTRTINQMFAAKAAGLEDTRTIAVRHNPKVIETYRVQIDGDLYKIENISPDDTNGFMTFDFITLSKITGVKGG